MFQKLLMIAFYIQHTDGWMAFFEIGDRFVGMKRSTSCFSPEGKVVLTIGGVWMFKCPTAPGSPNGLITRSRDKPKVSALPITRDI